MNKLSSPPFLALHRLGLGVAGQLPSSHARADRQALTRLLLREAQDSAAHPAFVGLPSTSALSVQFIEFRMARRQMRQRMAEGGGTMGARRRMRSPVRSVIRDELAARFSAGFDAPTGFGERLVSFWANHFTVAHINPRVGMLCGAFEREAIRPHVTGRFAEMLLAATRHPAMLRYLDNARSIGPNSRVGQRRQRGLNENHARELLELHTVGPDAHDQDDVRQLAEILTGWGLTGRRHETPGVFRFRRRAHEPGTKVVLGRRYEDRGVRQGEAVLDDLAGHEKTARRVSRKLIEHFTGREATRASVDRLAIVFERNRGALMPVYQALLALPEIWEPQFTAVRTPYDYIMASCRLVGGLPTAQQIYVSLRIMGQQMYKAPSPKGWPEDADFWIAPDTLKTRLEWAEQIARKLPQDTVGNPLERAQRALGPLLRRESALAIQRAETAEQGLVLLLMSPEFQKR